MANYAVPMTRTASTTASVGSVTADATRPRRGIVYEIAVAAAVAGDNPFIWNLQRCTAAGTSTGVTPRAINPADAATEFDAGENHTVEPTYTATTVVWQRALNQRTAYRWVAAPGKGLVYPATASNGFGVQTPTSTAVAVLAELYVEEQ